MYDTVAQYGQVVSGEVSDWHPPAMVRLWQVLHPLASGTAPMFALQVALYAVGFGLIVATLERIGRRRAGIAVAAIGVSPLLIGWQMVVLKDAQMLGALLAAIGLVAHFRLPGRSVPTVVIAVVTLLIAYVTLVRANAVFATAPLVAMLTPWPRPFAAKAAAALVAMALILGLSPLINHQLMGAEPSGVAKSQPLFDLAAIAVANPADPGPFTPAELGEIASRHCAKAFFWDPLGDGSACAPTVERLQGEPEAVLYRALAAAAVRHPLSYAAHRLAHWNSTERWLVPSGLIAAAPPKQDEPNDLGLVATKRALVPAWQSAAAAMAASPLGWPIFWTALASLFAPVAWRRRDEPTGGLALALVASALTLEASFLVISIASDLRYHLWPMAASAVAAVLLGDGVRSMRSSAFVGAAMLALVVAGGLATRLTLPRAPDNYQAMIHSAAL